MSSLGLSTYTQTGATVSTANATDLATAQALANALKTDYNKTITDHAAVITLLNEIINILQNRLL